MCYILDMSLLDYIAPQSVESNELRLIHPRIIDSQTGKPHITKINVLSAEKINGGEETKYKLIALLGTRTIYLVEKFLKWNNADQFIEKRNVFKELGIPVVETVRKIDRRRIVMTDEDQKGVIMYGKKRLRAYQNDPLSKDPINDPKFVNIIHNHWPEIKAKVTDWTNKLTQEGHHLAPDDIFENFIYSDGSWKFMPLDLSQARLHKRERRAAKINNKALKEFEYVMYNLYKEIKGFTPPPSRRILFFRDPIPDQWWEL